VTRGQLPQRAGSLGLNGGGAATAVTPTANRCSPQIRLWWVDLARIVMYCKRAFNQYGSSVTDMIIITVSQLGEVEQSLTPHPAQSIGHFGGGLHSHSLDWYWQTKQYRKIHKLNTTQKKQTTAKQNCTGL